MLFCGFIAVFSLLNIVLPDQSFSESEKRALMTRPSFSARKLFEGEFSRDFETYLSDQFTGRNVLAGINAYYNLSIGRNGINDIYAGKDGYLIEAPVKGDASIAERNADAFAAFGKSIGIVPDLMIVPTTGYIYDHKLPAVHQAYPDGDRIAAVQARLGDGARSIDLAAPFFSERDNRQLYYKTDHHWTTEGAYLAYQVYCAAAGLEAAPPQRFDIERISDFYGTTYSRSALWLSAPDTMELFLDNTEPVLSVEFPQSDTQSDSLYFYSHLQKADKYPVFLDGNHGYVRIVNAEAEGGALLLVKDSFAHAMVPFLIQHYNKIIMVDPRYYRQDVGALAKLEEVDSLLILYGLPNLVGDASPQGLTPKTPAAPAA